MSDAKICVVNMLERAIQHYSDERKSLEKNLASSGLKIDGMLLQYDDIINLINKIKNDLIDECLSEAKP